MISVQEAIAAINRNVKPLVPVTMPVAQSLHYVLAEDVYAALDFPSFRQSSMDGYAIRFNDFDSGQSLIVSNEIPAGDTQHYALQKGEACRIFTGAPVPDGADTVVMQEKTQMVNGALIIDDVQLHKGANVREIGADILCGQLALEKGAVLTPAAIGFLITIGIKQVVVFSKPSIALLVTGNELLKIDESPAFGKIYESNSHTLRAALQFLHHDIVETIFVKDDLKEVQSALSDLLLKHDLILITGGVSVGDYDYVVKAAEQCEVKQIFHKVKQRPGKPLYFGVKENKVVFGLPGNPSSVLTCFYEYVLLALRNLCMQSHTLQVKYAPLKEKVNKVHTLTHFMKGYFDGETVVSLDAQESFRLSSFARANCLIKLDEPAKNYDAGEMVEIHLLP